MSARRQALPFELGAVLPGMPVDPAPARRVGEVRKRARTMVVRCPGGDHTALIVTVGEHLVYAKHLTGGERRSCPIGGLDTADAGVPRDSAGRLPRPEAVCPACREGAGRGGE